MCGISGIHKIDACQKLSYKTAEELVSDSLERIRHRGPDHSGWLRNNQCVFGHNRLRIQDLSEDADQPMSDASGRFNLVFNGEIFNFRELRNKPELFDYPFKTSSDTEVLLALLIRVGRTILNDLNGFFSFAFYDSQTDELLLARDRYGEKPMWYSDVEHTLFFSSELRGLEAFPIPRDIDELSLAYFLQLTYIPAPSSIYTHFKKLEPGSLLISNSTGIRIEKWYKGNNALSENRSLSELLEESVKLRLFADVPVGAFLSGGIDSSIICALASKHTSHLQTYSIGFPEEIYLDESRNAALMARHIGSNHTSIPLTEKDILESLGEYLNSLDEPFADSSSIALFFLCKYTKQNVSVALSGDGADEIFGGYRKHKALWSSQKKSMMNQVLRLAHPLLKNASANRGSGWRDKLRQLSKYSGILSSDQKDSYWKLAAWCDDSYIQSILGKKKFIEFQLDRKKHLTELDGSLNSVLKADQQLVLSNDMLVKTDSMSMAHALEMRSPFLDYRVVEFANRLHADQKINKQGQKWILRETFGNLLPSEILNGKKKGFEVPLDRWVKGPLRSEITETLSSLDSVFIDRNQVMKLLKKDNIKEVPSSLIWSLFVFQKWMEKRT
jgi:asparagine synthase (glutamine-hydrolysing)